MDLALLEEITRNENASRKGYFDILEIATRMERTYGAYFKPYTGEQLYFDFSSRPALDFTKNSYHIVTDKDPLKPGVVMHVPVKSHKDVTNQDIYDQNDRLVVRGKDARKLRVEPTDPVRMLNFIEDYVKDYCRSRIPVFEKEGRGLDNLVEAYLSEEMLADFEALKKLDKQKKTNEAEHFVAEFFYLIEPVLSSIREFMGPNKWTIFLVRRNAFDLVVDAFVDYRIYDYHERLKREHESKCQES